MVIKKKRFWLTLLAAGLTFFFSSGFLDSQQRFRRTPPYPDPLPPINLPKVESAVLPTGLKIITINGLNNPVYNLQILIQAGESDSPPGLSGLATIAAQMLFRGTITLNRAEIEEKIEYLGINYSVEVRPDYTIFSFVFLEEFLDQVLELINLFFVEPTFPAMELASAKREFYYRLLDKNRDSEKTGYEFFLKQMFVHSGYNPGVVDEELIKNITTKDVAAFHQRLFRPNNSTIIITGNLDMVTAEKKIRNSFSRWVPKPVEKPSRPKLLNKNFEKICLLDLPVQEVSVIAGNVIAPLTDEDYFGLLVLNQIMGGATTSRLFLNLRESKSLAFYAFSELSFLGGNGLFWIRIKTAPESIVQIIRELHSQFRSLTETRIDPAEVERAKAYLIGNLPLQFQTPEALSRRIGLLSLFQLPEDFWNKYYQNIMVVSPERVQEVAKKYLTNNPLIIIVADLKTVLDYLREFDKIEIYNRKGQIKAISEKGVLKYEAR